MSKPSLLDRLFRRKDKVEVNPFTGETVKIEVPEIHKINLDYEVNKEDRLDKWGRGLIQFIGIIVTMYNFLMFLGYVSTLDIFFSMLFAFSTYFSIIYVQRSHRDRLEPINH